MMGAQDEIVELLEEQLPYLAAEFGVKRIGLFGSYARNTAGEASDVDLVIEFEQPIGLRFIELAEHLEYVLGRRVDLLTPAGLQSIRLANVAEHIAGDVRYV
jgi:uncharacterized protein